MQRRKPLLVTLDATQPSTLELTLREHVQLDRVITTPHGRIAERHGALLAPGTTRVALAPGHFAFRTLSDAQLRVVEGGVSARIGTHIKDAPPEPPSAAGDPSIKGDAPDGQVPTLTLIACDTGS